jgi:hypothetical protein
VQERRELDGALAGADDRRALPGELAGLHELGRVTDRRLGKAGELAWAMGMAGRAGGDHDAPRVHRVTVLEAELEEPARSL